MNETTQDNLNTSQSINSEIADIIQAVEITSDVLNDTRKDVQAIKSSMLSKKDITKLKPNDGKNGKDGLNGKDGRDGLDGADGLDGSPDTPAQVRDKLSSLKGDKRLDKSAIKGLEDIIGQTDLDRAVSILDSRTSFLINKINNLGNTGGGGGSGPFSGITGTPTEIAYFDLAGNGYSDALASRDSVTNETYIGYRTSGGDFSNALKLGNFLGSFITDGTGFERHDAVNDNFTFSAAIDGTPISATTNTLLQGYADLTNGVFATGTYNADEAALDYSNSVTGTEGHIVANSTRISIEHTDNSTYESRILVDESIDLQADGLSGTNIFRVSDTFIRGGSSRFYFYADTTDDTFYVRGQLPTTGTPPGALLFVDVPNAVSTLGDYNEQMSHIKVVADVANKNAYVDGLAKTVPNWTPSTLSDGFTGTGLNDMKYDSTTTYTGTYPNIYTATIVSLNSVYVYLTSITTPGFTVGDTVTDGASTGTIIAGSDGDGFIIIQPIIDTGWTSATSITDISSGAASSVGGLFYTDTMSWSSTAGGSGIIIPTSSFISLGDGLSVRFVSPTGHTIGDSWTWEMIANYTYSKMALFDGFNGIQVIGDVNEALDGIRTEWVHDTTKGGAITEYLGEQGTFSVVSNAGNIFNVIAVDTSTSGDVIIYNPYSGVGYDLFRVTFDNAGLGIGIRVSDNGSQRSVLIGDDVGVNNGTNIFVDDIAETITLTASHISAPLSAYADDADAGTNGVVTGELYQTDGTGTAPLNIAGIVMVKQ